MRTWKGINALLGGAGSRCGCQWQHCCISMVTGVPSCRCLSAGARLHDEADAPSQWEHRECRWRGRSGGVGWGGVPTTALPPTYCYAQQYLPTPHTVSAGKNWYNSENSCREIQNHGAIIPQPDIWNLLVLFRMLLFFLLSSHESGNWKSLC